MVTGQDKKRDETMPQYYNTLAPAERLEWIEAAFESVDTEQLLQTIGD